MEKTQRIREYARAVEEYSLAVRFLAEASTSAEFDARMRELNVARKKCEDLFLNQNEAPGS